MTIFIIENQKLQMVEDHTEDYNFLAQKYKKLYKGNKKECEEYLEEVGYEPTISIPVLEAEEINKLPF